MQAVQKGDWFVGWVQVPEFSEFDAGGNLLFDASFPRGTQSYRSYRFSWTGAPAHSPSLSFHTAAGGGGVVYASWNGSTLVDSWIVLAGTSPTSLTGAVQVRRSGFETAIALAAATGGPRLGGGGAG